MIMIGISKKGTGPTLDFSRVEEIDDVQPIRFFEKLVEHSSGASYSDPSREQCVYGLWVQMTRLFCERIMGKGILK
jgi:hypothetical protein